MNSQHIKERVLITGGTGFVGPYLINHLKSRGFHVTVFAVSRPERSDTEVQYIHCDITDEDSVRRVLQEVAPSRVYHLAAISEVGASWSNPRRTFEINVIGTYNVFEAAMQLEYRPKVLNVSTSQVYAPSTAPLCEKSPVRPDNPYSASKAMSEFMSVQYKNIVSGGIITARAFNHSGPGQSPSFFLSSVARQFAQIELGLRAPTLNVGNLKVERDFTDVRDVVRAYDMLLDRGRPDDIYNVCSGVPVQLTEVVQLLRQIIGVDVHIEADSSKMRSNETQRVCGDCSKIRDEVGWSPMIPFETTVRDTLEYWRVKCRGHAEQETTV